MATMQKFQSSPKIMDVVHAGDATESLIDSYSVYYKGEKNSLEDRESRAREVTETFYELVTDFYEYGYGQSFHFSPAWSDKTNEECIVMFQHEIGRLLNLKPGTKVLDIGCGVGGPAREIAKFTGANIVGLNYSDYQLKRAQNHTKEANLQHLVTYVKSDFCHMVDIEENTFDAAYALEATCHAEDPLLVFKETFRVLKPGGLYYDSSWVMTDKYVPGNTEHDKIKHGIMTGNGLPDIRTIPCLLDKMREAGFEIVKTKDCQLEGDIPWYTFLTGKACFSLQNFRVSSIGRFFTHYSLSMMELFGVVPVGSTKVHSTLLIGADNLTASGKLGIFSPLYRIIVRKPI